MPSQNFAMTLIGLVLKCYNQLSLLAFQPLLGSHFQTNEEWATLGKKRSKSKEFCGPLIQVEVLLSVNSKKVTN